MAVPAFTTGTAVISSDLQWMFTTRPLTFCYSTAAQTFTNTANIAATFNSEAIDRYNMHAGSSSQVNLGLELGWYQVQGGLSFVGSAGGGLRGAYIALNGTRIAAGATELPAVGNGSIVVNTPATMVHITSALDYIEIQGRQDSGGYLNTLQINGLNTWVSCIWLGS